jgi:hypothetical protein
MASTGDMGLDIAFSDHRMSKQSLEELGAVVAAIHKASHDDKLCFWTFIRYIALNYPTILGVELKPELERDCDQLLQGIRLPSVTISPSPREELMANINSKGRRRWWQFWKRNESGKNGAAES